RLAFLLAVSLSCAFLCYSVLFCRGAVVTSRASVGKKCRQNQNAAGKKLLGSVDVCASLEIRAAADERADAGSPPWVRNVSVAQKYGNKKLPNALIVGVKKGGTRAVLEFIRIHPDVRALGTEPHFFDRNYERGLDWYRGLMPRTLDGQITLEKTPSYFVTREAPRRIAGMSQETKLIVVVRNPVTRAISDYTQTLSKKPDIPTFEDLAFKNRSLGLVDASWTASASGLYILHLENWLQYFRPSQMHFVSGERLITDPGGGDGPGAGLPGAETDHFREAFLLQPDQRLPLPEEAGEQQPAALPGKVQGQNARPDPAGGHRAAARLLPAL
ncbi:unnamed protein product, partial [Tetraodon nigroviridis]